MLKCSREFVPILKTEEELVMWTWILIAALVILIVVFFVVRGRR